VVEALLLALWQTTPVMLTTY